MDASTELVNEYIESLNAEVNTLVKEKILLRAQHAFLSKQIQTMTEFQNRLQEANNGLQVRVRELEEKLTEVSKPVSEPTPKKARKTDVATLTAEEGF